MAFLGESFISLKQEEKKYIPGGKFSCSSRKNILLSETKCSILIKSYNSYDLFCVCVLKILSNAFPILVQMQSDFFLPKPRKLRNRHLRKPLVVQVRRIGKV